MLEVTVALPPFGIVSVSETGRPFSSSPVSVALVASQSAWELSTSSIFAGGKMRPAPIAPLKSAVVSAWGAAALAMLVLMASTSCAIDDGKPAARSPLSVRKP